MKQRKIFVTSKDCDRLTELLLVAKSFNRDGRNDLAALETELGRARIVDSQKIPATVVTMNTRLRFMDLDDQTETEITLVFPSDADLDAGKLSVLSPIGMALLGYAVGDTIEWNVPDGVRRIKIEKILYQPEASGDLEL